MSEVQFQYQEDVLPDIWFKTKLDPKEFTSSVRQILKTEKGYKNEVITMSEADDPTRIISIMPEKASEHNGFFWQFIVSDKNPGKIEVELRASNWAWENQNYEIYVAAAKTIVQPFLKKYSGRLGTNGKIFVEKKGSLEPKLSPPVRARLDAFIGLANNSALHPLDWKRFYSFIRYCNRTGARVSSEDVKRILWKSGFSPGYAERIGEVFYHGREILRVR